MKNLTSYLAMIIGLVSLGLSLYVFMLIQNIGVQNIKQIPAGNNESRTLINLIKQSSQSVVSIVAREKDFDNYAHLFLDQVEPAVGTGFVVDPGNLIVTNEHVVYDAYLDYFIVLNDGTYKKVKKINRDRQRDIAILHVEKLTIPGLPLADSDKVEVGQKVVAIGNATGRLPNSVTTGIVSGLGRIVWTQLTGNDGVDRGSKHTNLIQTDAAINPGNSGGPLINMNGEVVGVNVAKSWSENTGFAIPTNNLVTILQSISNTGTISKAYLGVKSIFGESSVRNQQGKYDDYSGEVIEGVEKGSPAEKSGILKRDIILKFDNIKMTAGYSLTDALAKANPGDKVVLEVLRSDAKNIQNITLTLGEKVD